MRAAKHADSKAITMFFRLQARGVHQPTILNAHLPIRVHLGRLLVSLLQRPALGLGVSHVLADVVEKSMVIMLSIW